MQMAIKSCIFQHAHNKKQVAIASEIITVTMVKKIIIAFMLCLTRVNCQDPNSQACIDASTAAASNQMCTDLFNSLDRALCSGTCADLYNNVATACGADVSYMSSLYFIHA